MQPLDTRPGATVVIDGQWGSSGKGRVESWLYRHCGFDVGVGDNMPNAGHTVINSHGGFVLKALPVAAAEGLPCYIGPNAVFSRERLLAELRMIKASYGGIRPVLIHEQAGIVTSEDAESERDLVNAIASTGQGSTGPCVRKILRQKEPGVAKAMDALPPDVSSHVSVTGSRYFSHSLNQVIDAGRRVLLEGSQGFDLSLNWGTSYPFVTSRDCLPGRLCDNAGLAISRVRNVIAVVRTYPIRVGNVGDVSSGPHWSDQREIDWGEVSARAGREIPPEVTTVTRRVRRVFTFSWLQFRYMMSVVRPTHVVLTFADYLTRDQFGQFVGEMNGVLSEYGSTLLAASHGASHEDPMEVFV